VKLRQLRENIIIAWRSIKGQMLRTVLTIFIIALGIMSLVGMLTAIDVLKQSINDNFAFLGANTFTIRNRGFRASFGKGGQRPKKHPVITYEQALQFKNSFQFPGSVSVSAMATQAGVIKRASKKTNPNIPITGCDDNYLDASGFEIAEGRNFTPEEVQTGRNVTVIGAEIKKNLFGGNNCIDQEISIGPKRYTIIGVLASKGAGIGISNDRSVLITLNNLRQNYKNEKTSFVITVKVARAELVDPGIDEATGKFRIARADLPGRESSFEIVKSDSIIKELLGMTAYISIGSVVIAVITLLGALIGLLNIMLVSVTERTREIGVRKAIGATRRSIALQFLIEAILICQLGGALGVVLGIGIGNLMTVIFGGSFIIPWNWIITAVVVCFVVGVISGFYPALRASKLDPVESLRYE
jgi:putative ABC transport system permease protein